MVAMQLVGFVGNQFCEFAERVLGAHDGAHLDPVAEKHDGDEGRELPPEVHAGEAQSHRRAVAKRHNDRERDEQHHAGLLRADLLDAALEKDESAVKEEDDAEDRGNVLAEREPRSVETEDVLQSVREHQCRDRQHEAQPELALELRGVVALVVVVRVVAVGLVAFVAAMGAVLMVRVLVVLRGRGLDRLDQRGGVIV